MIKVVVPATSANCCVGFDSLGIALDWWAEFCFDEADQLTIQGCPPQFQNEDNLVIQAFYKTCDTLGKEHPTLSLSMENEIPFQRGMGTSALCIVAGILAADQWFHAGMNKMEMLAIATEIEGHPDNVAPALFGHAVVSFMEETTPRMMLIPCADWHALILIPEEHVSTKDARQVLPDSIPFSQATQQVAHALAFSQALQIGNEMVLFSSCKDYLHEPYRKALIPEYESVHSYCQEHSIPMWISGSGSSMVALSMDADRLQSLQQWANQELKVKTWLGSLAAKGAEVIHE